MGMVSSKSKLATEHRTATEAGFHRCWYPVALARDLAPGSVIGRDLLGTRVVAYRDAAGKPVVQSAWCPHLGADLSVGQIVEAVCAAPTIIGRSIARACAPTSQPGTRFRPPPGFSPIRARKLGGLIWAFNGECADFPVPRIPGADGSTVDYEAHERGHRPWDTWVAVSNGVDFQHLRTLHGLPAASMPERLEVEAGCHRVSSRKPATICSTDVSVAPMPSRNISGSAATTCSCCSAAPRSRPAARPAISLSGFPKDQPRSCRGVHAMVDKLNEEDAPVLSTMRFRRGLLTASDRHLASYFRYVEAFPCFSCQPRGEPADR